MKRLDGLALRQRIVVVIALGLVLWNVGDWLTSRSLSGWFGYVPLSRATYPSPFNPASAVLIRSVLTIVWAGVSVRLLREPDPPRSAS
jgi:hypothetical protein